jgi:hypothetical protein
MASDSDYDNFDYDSTQDSFDIDYQIDLFEFRYYVKSTKAKQKIKKYSCPISVKTCRSHTPLIRVNCTNYKITPKAERKSFRYDRYPQKSKHFEYDEQFQEKPTVISNSITTHSSKNPTSTQPDISSNTPKILEAEHLESFSNFRRHFYRVHRQRIKSSFKYQPNIVITDIRLAPVNESVQNDFMKILNQHTSSFPKLVYHGTNLKNMENILRYGFLLPNQAHSLNSKECIMVPEHDRICNTRIYCSRTAFCSLPYLDTSNTLLICAAIPKPGKVGKAERCLGDLLVLSRVLHIIPVFLIDFKYSTGTNHPWFNEQKESKTDENKEIEKPVVISRKYLRKVLNWINEQERKNNQHQVRMFESTS